MNEPTAEASVPAAPKHRAGSLQAVQRRKQGALLVAQGRLSDTEIAAQLGLKRHAVREWKKRDDFRAMVEEFSRQIIAGSVQSVQERLTSDAPRNVQFLADVRDGNFQDDTQRMRVRLRASEALFDRQVPKHAPADGAIKVVIDQRLLGQMARAMRADGADVDATIERAVLLPPEDADEAHE